jgi:hypothetical protein
MSEIPDDELDDLFRKSAEETEIPFDPEAWRRMEQKLEGTRPNGTIWWPWMIGLGAFLLLLGTGVYLWQTDQKAVLGKKTEISGKQQGFVRETTDEATPIAQREAPKDRYVTIENNAIENNATDAQKKTESASAKPSAPSETEDTENTVRKQDERASEEDRTPPTVVKTRTAGQRGRPATSLSDARNQPAADIEPRRFLSDGRSGKTMNATVDNTEKTDTKNTEANGQRRETESEENKNSGVPVGRDVSNSGKKLPKRLPENTAEKETNRKSSVSRQAYQDNSLTDESLTASNLKTTRVGGRDLQISGAKDTETAVYSQLAGKNINAAPPVSNAIKPVFSPVPMNIQPPAPTVPSRFGIRLVAAPDLSTVGFREFVQPGTNAGVLFEYRFAPRWLVSAGGIYTHKIYSAEGKDYNPPSKYWTNQPGVYLADVDARCRIIDLPINVRYEIAQRPRGQWFVSGGASSYLMAREDYDYKYYRDGQYGERSWSISRSNNHFFAIGNLSFGYERAVTRRFSWQVEPYVKLPLGGVGFGSIRLISSGVFFSVKYHPFSRKW